MFTDFILSERSSLDMFMAGGVVSCCWLVGGVVGVWCVCLIGGVVGIASGFLF